MCQYKMNQSQTMIGIRTCKDKIVRNVEHQMIDRSIGEYKLQAGEHLREGVVIPRTLTTCGNK